MSLHIALILHFIFLNIGIIFLNYIEFESLREKIFNYRDVFMEQKHQGEAGLFTDVGMDIK